MTLEKASVDQRYYRVTSISLMVNSHINDAWINTHSHNFASLAPKLRRLGQRNLRMWKRGAPHWWLRSCQADNGQSHLLVMSNPGVAPDQTTHKFSSGEYIPYIIIYGFALNDECVIPWSTPGWVMFIHIYIYTYIYIHIYIYTYAYYNIYIYAIIISCLYTHCTLLWLFWPPHKSAEESWADARSPPFPSFVGIHGGTKTETGKTPGSYPLVMTNNSPWYRWPIEIDGLPNLNMVDLFI